MNPTLKVNKHPRALSWQFVALRFLPEQGFCINQGDDLKGTWLPDFEAAVNDWNAKCLRACDEFAKEYSLGNLKPRTVTAGALDGWQGASERFDEFLREQHEAKQRAAGVQTSPAKPSDRARQLAGILIRESGMFRQDFSQAKREDNLALVLDGLGLLETKPQAPAEAPVPPAWGEKPHWVQDPPAGPPVVRATLPDWAPDDHASKRHLEIDICGKTGAGKEAMKQAILQAIVTTPRESHLGQLIAKGLKIDIYESTPLQEREALPMGGALCECGGEDCLANLLEAAWGIIANANGGDWSLASEDWREAAGNWRDDYFRVVAMPKPTELPPLATRETASAAPMTPEQAAGVIVAKINETFPTSAPEGRARLSKDGKQIFARVPVGPGWLTREEAVSLHEAMEQRDVDFANAILESFKERRSKEAQSPAFAAPPFDLQTLIFAAIALKALGR